MSQLPAPDFSPDELVARCQAGERAAFDEIVRLYGARIHRLCYHALADEDEAADAAQDALVRAWRFIGNFRGESASRPANWRAATTEERRENLWRAANATRENARRELQCCRCGRDSAARKS